MATFKPIAINRTGVQLPFNEGQFIVATQPFTDGVTTYQAGVYVDMGNVRQQLTMQGVQGEKGETGATGATGADGQAATVSVGQVQTGAPGSNALVTNSGTPLNAVLDFLLPRGEAGPTGQQGASIFHSAAPSATTVAIGSLQPQLTPLVEDAVAFPNGDVRQVTGVGNGTVSLGEVLFTYKGDAGIGDATLSNTDGDSTENGFTQAAVKGVAQAKNYYNLGVDDTFVSNGDSTAAVSRKTDYWTSQGKTYTSVNVVTHGVRIQYAAVGNEARKSAESGETNGVSNYLYSYRMIALPGENNPTAVCLWQGHPAIFVNGATTAQEALQYIEKNPCVIQYEIASTYQYTEKVIENQPIRPANQKEECYWHEEWRKGLNLCYTRTVSQDYGNNHKLISIGTYKAGTYTIVVGGGSAFLYTGATLIASNIQQPQTFTLSSKSSLSIDWYSYNDNLTIMLVEGNHPYAPADYNGAIIREKDLSGVQLFPEGVNPAQTIGGDWEDEGTVTTSNSTVFHAYRRL